MPSVLVGVLALAAAPVDGGDAAAQGRFACGLQGAHVHPHDRVRDGGGVREAVHQVHGGRPWPYDCSSPKGLDVSKVNEVFITSCPGKRAVVHEILHSLGLSHEHQRTDRDEYINGLSDEGMGKKEGQFSQNLRPYDYKSIMHD